MLNGRRVGTLTGGIVLVMFGLLFLLRTVTNVNIRLIASLWPIILILLGIEIILSYIINKQEKIQYDFAAIILVIILVFFAMGMGVAEFVVNNLSHFRGTIS